MKNVLSAFRKIPKKVLMLALVIAVAASMVAVAGTFAVFQTTVIGLGETPISDWNFDVRINNDDAVDSVVSGVKLSGDNETTEIDSVTYNLHNTRDDSTEIADYLIAPGTSGYMPIEVDGSDSSVAMVITVKAEFSYTNGFSFTDNLRRTLAITAESESYSYDDEESNAVNATYVGYITYSYYVSYEQVSHWAEDDYIDIGFRWDWSEDDDTAYDDIPEYVYTRISVTGKQITNANQIKSADTIINFLYDSADIESQLQFGSNVLNILNTNVATGLKLENVTGDLYLDVNANGFAEASATSKLYGTMLQGTLEITTTNDVNLVIGTNRTQHGYLSEYIASSDYLANIPYVSIEAPNADAYISNDFIASKVQTANNFIDILNASMERMGESKTMYKALSNILADSVATVALADYNNDVNVTTLAELETMISAQYGNCDVVWDSESNRFAYISADGNTVVTKDETSSINLTSGKYKLFKAYSAMPATQTYSIYAVDSWAEATITDLQVGLDVGANDDITAITYVGTSTAKTVIINTNSYDVTITVNAANDVVNHYGKAGAVEIIAVGAHSYHEYGNVPFMSVQTGRVALESESIVGIIHLTTSTVGSDTTFNKIIIAKDESVKQPTLTRDAVTVASTGTLVVELQDSTDEDECESDYIWLYKQGTIAQMVITDTELTTITGSDSKLLTSLTLGVDNQTDDTTKAAEELANAYNGTNVAKYTDNNVKVPVLDENDMVADDASQVAESGSEVTDISEQVEAGQQVITEVENESILEENENYVARIEKVGYETLQAAIDASKDGGTIYLLSNIKVFTGIEQVFTKNLTIEAGGAVVQDDYGHWLSGGDYYILDNATGLKYYDSGRQVRIDGSFTGTDLYIPEGVEAVVCMKQAKNAANLTNIYFPTTITAINGRAFCDCTKLEKLYYKVGDGYVEGLPQTLTYLGESAFQSCGKLEMAIVIPDAISQVSAGAFYSTAITSVTFNSNITGIATGAFRTCPNLTEVHLPESIQTLGNAVFRDCANLTKIYFAFEEVPNSFETFSFASVSGLFNKDIARSVYVKTQDVADAFWEKLDSAAKATYSIVSYDGSTTYYPQPA